MNTFAENRIDSFCLLPAENLLQIHISPPQRLIVQVCVDVCRGLVICMHDASLFVEVELNIRKAPTLSLLWMALGLCLLVR